MMEKYIMPRMICASQQECRVIREYIRRKEDYHE